MAYMQKNVELKDFLLEKAWDLTEQWYDSLDKSDPTGVYSTKDPAAIKVLKEQNYSFHRLFCNLFVQDEDEFLASLEKWVHAVASDEEHLSTPGHFIIREFFRTREQYLGFIQEFIADGTKSFSHEDVSLLNQEVTNAIDKIVIWYMEKFHEFSLKRLRSQQEMINELSAPVITLNGDIALLPLVGDIDTMRAKYILEQTLHQCSEKSVSTLLIDLSGVVMIDTMVAHQLFQLIESLELIGVKAILSGIRPEIAQTSIQLGLNFDKVDVSSNLSRSIQTLFQTK